MVAYDSSGELPEAEETVSTAVNSAFSAYLSRARAAVLGDSGLPAITRWPGQTLWVTLSEQFIMPALSSVFGSAFTAAARSDLLQVSAYRTEYMATARNRLSQVLWPSIAFDRLRATLTRGVAEGASVPELREQASTVLGVDANSYLADRIARTEAHNAVEGGSYSATVAWEEATGERMYQRWLATNDTRTRASHRRADGQTVPVGQPFRVGGYSLAFPGDPTAPAEEVIQCRCSTLSGTLAELEEVPITAQGAPMPEDTAAIIAEDSPALPATVAFRGVLAPLDVRGDFRILASPDGAPKTADHMWLSWQERSAEGHDGKVSVGRIDRVWVDDGMLWGEGVFDMADETGTAQSVARKVRDGFAGTVSIDQTDLVDATFEYAYFDRDDNPVTPPADLEELEEALMSGDIRELLLISDWRLGGATLVQDPAFATGRDGKSAAFIEIVEPGVLTAAATGDLTLPLAPREREWDGDAALGRLQEAERLNDGTFWREADADPDSTVQADYRLPFADVIDGELMAVPQAIFTVAGVLQGAMGGVDLPEEDQDQIRSRVADYYERMAVEFDDDDIIPPWERDERASAAPAHALAASGQATWAERVAAAVPANPPSAWFSDPQMTGLSKVRITDEGRVYGHICDWKQAHIGFSGEQVYPPRSTDGGAYARFHRSPIRTAEGTRINTGPLTTAGHAETTAGVTMSAAMAHYDDPRFVLANVVCGEDQFGIWVSGALRPGVEAWQVAFGDTYEFSGDWRRGHLVAACTVSVGGFFVPSDDSVQALAASAGVTPQVARYRSVQADGETVALVSAGVLAPSKAATSREASARIFQAISRTEKTLSGQLETMAERVAEALYPRLLQALSQHAAESKEFAALAREMNADVADEVAGLAAEMEALA